MSARQKDLLKYLDYPESDELPMAETDKHRQLMVNLIASLQTYFALDPNIYVSGNLMCYYVEGDTTQSVTPDVFVVRGAAKHERPVYKLWEEPAPNVVLEISSKKTRQADLGEKKDLYAWLGVREYFVFDPEYKLKPPLRAFRLRRAELGEELVRQHRVVSHELGLELVNDGHTLRLWNPARGEFLRTPAEEAAARLEAEQRAARLAAKLRELGLDPDQL
jgi:Uma2 family endonuclease